MNNSLLIFEIIFVESPGYKKNKTALSSTPQMAEACVAFSVE